MKQIIHFTPCFDKFKSIIESKSLHLHYCKEDFCIGDKTISRAVHPMVSFSEYDISTIDNENITYGRFGVAFSREWVGKYKIHQVLYIERDSILANSLAYLLIARRKNATKQLSSKVKLSIMTIKCFTKNSRGYNSHWAIHDFDFKSENEWRYVPTKEQIDGNLISQDRRKFKGNENSYNEKLVNYPMRFSANDIEFLFVKTQEQIDEILKLISISRERVRISSWKTELK